MVRFHLFISFLLLATAATFWSGCLRDRCRQTVGYTRYEPIYQQPESFRDDAAIRAESPRPLRNPGKLYIIGDYLLINEPNEGIHVFDNRLPEQPIPVAFWNIPGNVDMAVRGRYLYADQYADLLAMYANPKS